MNTIKRYTFIILLLSISFITQSGQKYPNSMSISYTSYLSEDLENPDNSLTISGQLRIPSTATESEKVPAVIILHGSAGVDSRGSFYTQALNRAGIATFEIDMWAARNLSGGNNRPALPSLTAPDAFNALSFLAKNSVIDENRIAALGFSWGGVVSMLAATEEYNTQFGNGYQFAALVAHYPICWAYNLGIPGINFESLTGSPILIQIGELDDYDEGSAPCQNLIDNLSTEEKNTVYLNVYKHSHHAWDRLENPLIVEDPFSHLGQGGQVDIAPNKPAAYKARLKVVQFIKNAFIK